MDLTQVDLRSSKPLRNAGAWVREVPRRRRPAPKDNTDDFLDTPMYELVDRHRAVLEKIKSRDDAEYWGHLLIGELYPEIPNSRLASGSSRPS